MNSDGVIAGAECFANGCSNVRSAVTLSRFNVNEIRALRNLKKCSSVGATRNEDKRPQTIPCSPAEIQTDVDPCQ